MGLSVSTAPWRCSGGDAVGESPGEGPDGAGQGLWGLCHWAWPSAFAAWSWFPEGLASNPRVSPAAAPPLLPASLRTAGARRTLCSYNPRRPSCVHLRVAWLVSRGESPARSTPLTFRRARSVPALPRRPPAPHANQPGGAAETARSRRGAETAAQTPGGSRPPEAEVRRLGPHRSPRRLEAARENRKYSRGPAPVRQ